MKTLIVYLAILTKQNCLIKKHCLFALKKQQLFAAFLFEILLI